ncbi:PREDICTED: aggrecan core protein-like isoform X1, partial [Scomber scombrus]
MLCVLSWYHRSGEWWPTHCGSTYPFVCHSIAQPAVKRQVVKLRMKLDDPSVDLNDPAVKAQLLKQ